MSTWTLTRFAPLSPLLDTNCNWGCVFARNAIMLLSSVAGLIVSLPALDCLPRAMMNGAWLPCSVLYALTALLRVMLCSAMYLTCVPPLAGPAMPVTVRHDGYGTTLDTF